MEYQLRQATELDREWIYCLRVATLRAYVARTWGWDEDYQRERFRQGFRPSACQIVNVDGRDVGLLQVERCETELHLGTILVAPEYQRQGIGTALIRDLLAEARRAGVPVVLQVLRVNPARQLYERLGFTVTGETATHYQMRAEP
jgi:ribosomal protein S18 acetylase RimI-like enzyme